MTDSDTEQSSDTYESYYLAYGLFGIFMKWARNGYAESVQEMTQIVVERIFAGTSFLAHVALSRYKTKDKKMLREE